VVKADMCEIERNLLVKIILMSNPWFVGRLKVPLAEFLEIGSGYAEKSFRM